MKRSIGIYAIAIVIAGLLITSASGFSLSEDVSTSVSVKKLDMKAQTLGISECQSVDMKTMARPLDGSPVITDVGDQLHPSVAMFATNQFLGFRDNDIGQIVYYFSPDNGETYDGGIYYETAGDYPYNDYWKDGTAVIGTFVTDYLDVNGGATYHFEAADMTDTDSYALTYWDWSSYGWYDMIDASCAAAVNDTDWWWGINAYVMSTTYTDPETIQGNFIQYQTAADGYATISWYPNMGTSVHCDASVDEATMYSYCAFDMYNETSEMWELLLRCDNTQNWDDESDPVGAYVISSDTYNFEKPVIAANNDNIVIATESDGEIVIQYSTAGPGAEFSSVVIGEGSNPTIEYVSDEQYALMYIHDGSLYKTLSEDSGASWSTPEVAATNVIDEYKTVNFGDGAGIAMYEYDGEDADIYSADIFRIPTPIIEIKDIAGGFGKVTATVTNIGDAAAENVDWSFTVEGGLVFGGANEGTIATVGIEEDVGIASGFIIGFGGIDVDIKAGIATESVSGSVLLFFVNI